MIHSYNLFLLGVELLIAEYLFDGSGTLSEGYVHIYLNLRSRILSIRCRGEKISIFAILA